ncbi:MAG: hypothetical protein ACREIA_10275 [Opitutaceae bacterium]
MIKKYNKRKRAAAWWRALAFVAAACGTVVCCGGEQASIEPVEIPANKLRAGKGVVIGELGLPLGTVAEIEATVVDGGPSGMWVVLPKTTPEMHIFALSVERVNGRALSEPKILEFQVLPAAASFPYGVTLAPKRMQLSELLQSRIEEGAMTEAEAEAFRHTYMGSRHRLVVSEAGIFHGRPADLPDDAPIWAVPRFHFTTRLVVLAKRDLNLRETVDSRHER